MTDAATAVPPPPGADASLLATVLHAAPTGMLLVDRAGRVVMANAEAERISGYGRDELLGLRLESLLPERARDRHRRLERDYGAHPAPRHLGRGRDLVLRHRDGHDVAVEIGLSPLTHAGDAFVLASLVDISERKRVEEALRGAEQRLRTLFETIRLVVLELDAGGVVRYVNPFFLALTGHARDDVLGRSWIDHFVPEAERAGLRGAFEALLHRSQNLHHRSPVRTAGGERRMIAWHNTVLRDAAGTVTGTLSIGEDVTDHLRLESQFRQAQKMEAVGRLAGGVAHDFNNLLTAIRGYAEFLVEDLPAADPRRGDAQEIRVAADRATALTRQLLAFSRQQVLEPRVLDVNQVVQGIERLLRRLIGEDVALETALAPTLGSVRADPGQLEQVIVNLAVNARDAMPSGGRLLIETAGAELDESYALGHEPVVPGRYVMLAVSDTGEGLSDAAKAHLFEPFFTTKEPGKGTGLGLATVYGIVKQSGGYIWAYSAAGRGTTFKIFLPRVDLAADVVREEAPPATLRGSETVLLVEDEGAVRKLVREALTRYGYRVLEAARGEEALELLAAARPGEIRLLLTDVVLPGMTGPEIHARVASAHPEVDVIYMSGYTERAVQAREVFPPGTAFLQKPFTPTSLARKVREVLNRNPA